MSKSKDTTKTRELTEDELTAVSGGRVTMEDIIITTVVAPRDHNSGLGFSFGATQTGSF